MAQEYEVKAKELIAKFKEVIPGWSGDPSQANQIDTKNIKACAVICVNEIISVMSQWPEPRDITIQMELDYWQQVLIEINK